MKFPPLQSRVKSNKTKKSHNNTKHLRMVSYFVYIFIPFINEFIPIHYTVALVYINGFASLFQFYTADWEKLKENIHKVITPGPYCRENIHSLAEKTSIRVYITRVFASHILCLANFSRISEVVENFLKLSKEEKDLMINTIQNYTKINMLSLNICFVAFISFGLSTQLFLQLFLWYKRSNNCCSFHHDLRMSFRTGMIMENLSSMASIATFSYLIARKDSLIPAGEIDVGCRCLYLVPAVVIAFINFVLSLFD